MIDKVWIWPRQLLIPGCRAVIVHYFGVMLCDRMFGMRSDGKADDVRHLQIRVLSSVPTSALNVRTISRLQSVLWKADVGGGCQC